MNLFKTKREAVEALVSKLLTDMILMEEENLIIEEDIVDDIMEIIDSDLE